MFDTRFLCPQLLVSSLPALICLVAGRLEVIAPVLLQERPATAALHLQLAFRPFWPARRFETRDGRFWSDGKAFCEVRCPPKHLVHKQQKSHGLHGSQIVSKVCRELGSATCHVMGRSEAPHSPEKTRR